MEGNRLNPDLDSNPSTVFSEIAWTVHPMRDNLLKAILFWIILAVVIWAVYWNAILAFSQMASVPFTIAAGVALLVAVNSFYLPTRFYIDSTGAGFRRWIFHKHMTWTRMRSATVDKSGLFLSPFPVRSRLENFRGIYLYYRGNREDVIAVVRHYKPDLKGLPRIIVEIDNPPEAPDPGMKEDEGGW